jgi:hypothetical protein
MSQNKTNAQSSSIANEKSKSHEVIQMNKEDNKAPDITHIL